MPHYKDGTPAQTGDLVVGTTYNRPNADGTPRMIVGEIISLTPAAETCNCTIGFIGEPTTSGLHDPAQVVHELPVFDPATSTWARVRRIIDVDYGETRAFTLVHRPSWGTEHVGGAEPAMAGAT